MFNWIRNGLTRKTTGQAGSSRPNLVCEALEDRSVPASVSLGAAGNFSVLGLVGTQITNSNVTINGDVGVSQGGKLKNMAPSTITGNVYAYASGQYSGPGKLFGSVVIDPALLAQANADALTAAAQAAALTPTQTFGSITSDTTVTGNGGLNVITITGNITDSLILSGTGSDVFIVNVSGSVSLGGSETLGMDGGVTADHVLYNFTGASGTITTHVGNVLNGTLLAPTYSFSLDGLFNGAIIGGGKSITLLSGARVNQVTFNPPTQEEEGSLSGFVYLDANQDGVIDPAFDHGIANVVIHLQGMNDLGEVVDLFTSTDGTGAYSFTGLRAGTYSITETQPQGFADGTDYVGTAGGLQDVNPDTGLTDVFASINLASGQNGTNYVFTERNSE